MVSVKYLVNCEKFKFFVRWVCDLKWNIEVLEKEFI